MEFPEFLKEFIPEDKREEVITQWQTISDAYVKSQSNDLNHRIEILEDVNKKLKQEKVEEIDKWKNRLENVENKLKISLDNIPNNNDNNITEYKLKISELESQLKDASTQFETVNGKYEGIVSKYRQEAINGTLAGLLAESGVKNPAFQKVLLSDFSRMANFDIDTGRVFFQDGDNVLDAKQYLDNWKKTEESKPFIDVSGNSGSGVVEQPKEEYQQKSTVPFGNTAGVMGQAMGMLKKSRQNE